MHLHEEKRVYTGEPDEMVCECLSVERQEIEQTIEQIDAFRVGEVRRECAAGGGCGSCHEEIARLILSRLFGERLDFDSAHAEGEQAGHAEVMAVSVAAEIEQFVDEVINPRLASVGVTAKITELGEEAVLDLVGADEELKYTLSFWLDAEFDRCFHNSITVIIT